MGSARRDDQRAHDNRAVHEGACLLPEALHRYHIMETDRMEHILIVLVSSRAQLHLSRWTEVRLPTCSSNCGFCRTQIAQRDPCGNGDRCEPVGQVCCNFISHQPFRILSNHPSLSRSTTRRNFVFLIGIFRTNLLQVVQN